MQTMSRLYSRLESWVGSGGGVPKSEPIEGHPKVICQGARSAISLGLDLTRTIGICARGTGFRLRGGCVASLPV
jgi:hypothetical protein